MGMLFGGWYKEEEDNVNKNFGGDWNKYDEFKVQERLRIQQIINEPEETLNGITRGDIICTWNKEKDKPENEFWVSKIKNGRILGKFISVSNGISEEVEYNFKDYVKICNAIN